MANEKLFIENNQDKHIIFHLGQELYAAPLMQVREVIEYKKPKPIPNTASFFKGVINVRGEIIGVIDLRDRLGVQGEKELCQLIFESDIGTLAAIVDRVDSVSSVSDINTEQKNQVNDKTSNSFYVGVGKLEDSLVTIINLVEILSSEQLEHLQSAI